MVAISLYKGNLHKVPDVPHRWPRPTPKISLKDFKILLRRRARALSRLRSSAGVAATDVATTSDPNPAPTPNSNTDFAYTDPISANVGGDGGNRVDNPSSEPELTVKRDLKEEEGEKEEAREEGKGKDDRLVEREDCSRKLVEKTDALVKEEEKNEENVENDQKAEVSANPAVEVLCL